MILTYTKEEYLKKYDNNFSVYTKIEDIQNYIFDIIHKRTKEYRGGMSEYITVLEKWLDWVFEYTYKYQPKTAEVLKELKILFLSSMKLVIKKEDEYQTDIYYVN